MLVLTRRVGEEIIIDDNIRVTVVRIKGKKVLIGVTAPDELGVLRDELCTDQDRRRRIDGLHGVIKGHIT